MWEGLKRMLSVTTGTDVVYSSKIEGNKESGELWCKAGYHRSKHYLKIVIEDGVATIVDHKGIFSGHTKAVMSHFQKKEMAAVA